MAVKDILSRLGVKLKQLLTIAAVGDASTVAIDTQGFSRGLMFAIEKVATIAVTSITESGGFGTVTIADTSGLTIGDTFTISGADQSEYNGTHVIVAIPLSTTFTYAVSGSPVDATGTILMTVTGEIAMAAGVATGTYAFTDSDDNVTFAAVQAESVLPTRKQTGNTLVDTTVDANDSQLWDQGIGLFGNKRFVILTIDITVIATGVSLAFNLIPILAAEQTPFDVWDSTLTGDTEG